ncbi:glycoside hydrolase family 68 protein [Novosphingobium sp. Fuku2-ISO-50]|uniref:glycoside hydrolase family 68 protein n=1 Tax=Novosphingobium sp. Fuku2-ISO-50 TaxID=1739114 RepID=UPI0009EC47D9|nr:glycoside hydrolase family 68 protein [Novosphingobium sp. Fuku2-ISO-50]
MSHDPALRLQPIGQSIENFGASRWAPQAFGDPPTLPRITAADVAPILPGIDLWDCWPLAHEDGSTVIRRGRALWFLLSAPVLPDPADRHVFARIRLMSHGADGWRDHGHALPDGLNPGSREWAGSAVLADDGVTVTLYYTVAGRRGGPFSFEQRLFAVDGRLDDDAAIGQWQTPREIVVADGVRYVCDRQEIADPVPGTIKAFRDPAWFRDPATGKAHVVFTASAAWSRDACNGIVGIATREGEAWVLGDPLVEAIGVNNELERACLVCRAGRYYLFWSTQRHTFSPDTLAGPNGLYAMVADQISGPWRPVNGNGLVAANPLDEPAQSYSWWVTGEDEVWSFIDYWGMEGRSPADHPELLRSHFGGTPAPVFRLRYDGDRVLIAG